MRKITIVLIAVLLVLSMTSCQKDKSEEIISTYVEFKEGLIFGYGAYQSFSGLYTWDDPEVDKTLIDGEKITETYNLVRVLGISDDLKSIEITAAVTKSGKITGTKTEITNLSSRTLIFKDAVIEVTYTDYSGEEEKKDQKVTVTVNGTYSWGLTLNPEAKSSISSYSFDFTVNNKTYKVTTVYDNIASKITSATVNGKDVNLTLVNSPNF